MDRPRRPNGRSPMVEVTMRDVPYAPRELYGFSRLADEVDLAAAYRAARVLSATRVGTMVPVRNIVRPVRRELVTALDPSHWGGALNQMSDPVGWR